jgi:methionyl-tRNA synthetase
MQVRLRAGTPFNTRSRRALVAPHVGHLHSLVTADIFARHARLVRPDVPVHFLTGTDEHGLKIQQAARARGQDPQAFCDTLSLQFRVCLLRSRGRRKDAHFGRRTCVTRPTSAILSS